MLQADPGLHALLRQQTEPAFQQGGWAAASARMAPLKFRDILFFASDSAIAACDAAWLRVKQALARHKEACAPFWQGHMTQSATALAATASPACHAALLDGATRRRAGDTPRMMTEADYEAAYRVILSTPDPLSASEIQALQGELNDTGLLCAASLRRDTNLAALPAGVLAAYRRREYYLGAMAPR